MQDRFKFRVWYNPQPSYDDYPKMLYGAEKTYDFMRTPDLIPADSFGELLEDKDFIVMQCTGLKDKNGNLIYEGDIIIDVSVRNSKYPKGVFYVVYWEEDSAKFCIDAINTDKYYPYKTWHLTRHDLDYEIIGNIYENKELLNEKI